ncbi:hypothetical protein D3C78_1239280 [compost metagenome]
MHIPAQEFRKLLQHLRNRTSRISSYRSSASHCLDHNQTKLLLTSGRKKKPFSMLQQSLLGLTMNLAYIFNIGIALNSWQQLIEQITVPWRSGNDRSHSGQLRYSNSVFNPFFSINSTKEQQVVPLVLSKFILLNINAIMHIITVITMDRLV